MNLKTTRLYQNLNILLVNNAEPGITEFSEKISKIISEMGFTPVPIEYAASLNFNFETIDGIILTGSPQGDDIVEHHVPFFNWIKTCTKPIFGICAGHHITGSIYGSELLRNKEPESGDYEIEQVQNDPVFSGIPKLFQVKQMHNDSITVPEEFILLATSKTCKNQLMKHKQKPLYTCQFHPEYYNTQLIRNFIELCRK